MMHKLIEKADKIIELSMPLLDRLTDDTDDAVPEKALDACAKMIELAHDLYKLAAMKHTTASADNPEMDNPRKSYFGG